MVLSQSKEKPCNPDDLVISKPIGITKLDENADKDDVFVYFDQSLSMKGYVVEQPGQKNLYVDVIDDVQQISENIGSKVSNAWIPIITRKYPTAQVIGLLESPQIPINPAKIGAKTKE